MGRFIALIGYFAVGAGEGEEVAHVGEYTMYLWQRNLQMRKRI
jgi:hypothetical protein